MNMRSKLHEIKVHGSPENRGEMWGHALAGDIAALLDDQLARINYFRRAPINREDVKGLTTPYLSLIEQHLPDTAKEIRGLAIGAGVSVYEACLLQIRRELIATVDPNPCGCSTIVPWDQQGNRYIAQTVDLAGRMDELLTVVQVDPEKPDEPRAILLTFVGLLGYLGLNNAGVAVGINMVVSDDWKVGVPPYLIVRELLRQKSVSDCLAMLERVPRSSSRCFTILDSHQAVQVEMTSSEMRVLESHTGTHTNHYLHTDLAKHDRSHLLIRRSSKARFERLCELLQSRGEHLQQDTAFELLSDHSQAPGSICCHGDGSMRSFQTVAAVILSPATNCLAVRLGNPCQNTERLFRFDDA